jgi:hypothetical protein
MMSRVVVVLLLTMSSIFHVRCDEEPLEKKKKKKNPRELRVGVREDKSTPQKPSGSTWTPDKVHLEH